MLGKNNYYISSLFWSTLAKILNAVLGFITVPLLLGYYGKAEYGLLSIATACNGYMSVMDLGMNVGTVKFYSQWKAEGKIDKIFRVARSNITFYLVIAVINAFLLLGVAFWGEHFFAVTHAQFMQIRACLCIIALFSVCSWGTTVFNQLLIADKQMAYTMKIQCVQTILKAVAVAVVFLANIQLTTYFFLLTLIIALACIPYAIKCKRDGLLQDFLPAWYWGDFKIVLAFSVSIFALTLFQVTATQSRPILLSIFAQDGASVVAEFRILEVVPQLIIMIGGTFSGVFLPKTSEMVATGDTQTMRNFAYHWTTYTTVVVSLMCFPFMLCAKEVLTAYVGEQYAGLSKWLVVWCLTVYIQMHTTPGNALVLAHGKTKLLVRVTACACICSMVLNAFLCKYLEVGSAIVSYFLYTSVVIGLYYVSFYKKLLKLNRLKMAKCFATPTAVACLLFILVYFMPVSEMIVGNDNSRISNILVCVVKTLLWFVPYVFVLQCFKIVDIRKMLSSR